MDANQYFQSLQAKGSTTAIKPFSANTTIHLTVLSPTHVGDTKEKQWVEDVDFFYREEKGEKKGALYAVDKKALVQELGRRGIDLSTYVKLLKDPDYTYVNREKVPKDVYGKLFSNSDWGLDETVVLTKLADVYLPYYKVICPVIRDGQGHILVPGSSIKGALRTVLFQQFYKGEAKDWKVMREEVFGEITNNLMRLIRVGDAVVSQDQMVYHSTKIMSRDKKQNLVWKNSYTSGDHTPEIKPDKFATAYELLAPGASLSFRLGLHSEAAYFHAMQEALQAWKRAHQDARTPEKKRKTIDKTIQQQKALLARAQFLQPSQEPIRQLFRWSNQLVIDYVKEEIRYYQHRLAQAEDPKALDEMIAWLRENILKPAQEAGERPDYCIFRLGHGVGFHAITGDWQKKGKHIEVLSNKLHGKQYKTRKLVLCHEEKNKYQMRPMGYVRLSLEKHTTPFHNPQRAFLHQKTTVVDTTIALPFLGKMKKGVVLEAVLVKTEKDTKTRKLLHIFEYQENETVQTTQVHYPKGKKPLEIGKVYLLRITEETKKKQFTFAYHGEKR